ncbi:MAG: hypothetical protein Q7V02_05275 [Methylophilus sp.]|nr:hypothetical protein [Methylophilus sp.]
MDTSKKINIQIWSTTSLFNENLELIEKFKFDNDLIFPANNNELEIVAFASTDGKPLANARVNLSTKPHTLTGPEWRNTNNLVSRWPKDSAKKLEKRIKDGIVRLQSKLNVYSGVTDVNGKFYFKCSSWHVCGNEEKPASDLITVDIRGVSANHVVSCGIKLVEIPNDKNNGFILKEGILGKYCQDFLLKTLLKIGEQWKAADQKQKPFVVTESSLRWGGLIPIHLTHRFGLSLDLRPISTNNNSTSVGSPNYSRSGTRKLLELLHISGATEIIFNDPIYDWVKLDSKHNDHIHVTWYRLPNEPWLNFFSK